MPAARWPENTHAKSVPRRNSASGHLMAGRRSHSREISKAASDAPSRICETAMEKTIDPADANASQPAARNVGDGAGLMETELQYARAHAPRAAFRSRAQRAPRRGAVAANCIRYFMTGLSD